MKTPGQLAYEAYCATRYGTKHLPIWYGEISAEEGSAWEAAAKACQPVVDEAMVVMAAEAIYGRNKRKWGDSFHELPGVERSRYCEMARAALKAALGVV